VAREEVPYPDRACDPGQELYVAQEVRVPMGRNHDYALAEAHLTCIASHAASSLAEVSNNNNPRRALDRGGIQDPLFST